MFLTRSEARACTTDSLRPPNPDCPVCGVAQSRLVIDPARATLNDLVDDVLRQQLGYGDEITVNNEIGTVYDPDLDDNLPKKFAELGIKNESFLTIIDDNEEPRVNLLLSISEKSLPEDGRPVLLTSKPEIARKHKPPPMVEVNGAPNGRLPSPASPVAKRKRAADDEEGLEEVVAKKRVTLSGSGPEEDTIVLDDTGDGTIVIDD